MNRLNIDITGLTPSAVIPGVYEKCPECGEIIPVIRELVLYRKGYHDCIELDCKYCGYSLSTFPDNYHESFNNNTMIHEWADKK